jgi:hypothetical protein
VYGQVYGEAPWASRPQAVYEGKVCEFRVKDLDHGYMPRRAAGLSALYDIGTLPMFCGDKSFKMYDKSDQMKFVLLTGLWPAPGAERGYGRILNVGKF